MTELMHLNDAEDRQRDITNLLKSTFAKPNLREFSFPEGMLYVVARIIRDDRPGLVWVSVFPPRGNHTGLSWQEDFKPDEYTARLDLAAIDDKEAADAYTNALAAYRLPANH